MKKFIVIPDSFKGTLSAIEVCEIIEDKLSKAFPACEVISVPAADGGEGTVDCFFHARAGEKVQCSVKGPHFEDISASYGILGDTAVIEMAAAAGLHLAGNPMDPSTATTYGVGQLIGDAVAKGCKNIILGLGGSCTNDGGVGAAAALGARFFNNQGIEFLPTGGTLSQISKIDLSALKQCLESIQITAICDIENLVYGETGAAFVFAPQKGADPQMVFFLDHNLKAFANTIETSLGINIHQLKGGGAAGAMGAGAYALLGAELKPGIEVILDFIGFDDLLEQCDYVFTGEGKLDQQSLGGKVIVGVGRHAKAKNVPVIALVGFAEAEIASQVEPLGITHVFSATDHEMPLEQLIARCREDLSNAMDRAIAKIVEDTEQEEDGEDEKDEEDEEDEKDEEDEIDLYSIIY